MTVLSDRVGMCTLAEGPAPSLETLQALEDACNKFLAEHIGNDKIPLTSEGYEAASDRIELAARALVSNVDACRRRAQGNLLDEFQEHGKPVSGFRQWRAR